MATLIAAALGIVVYVSVAVAMLLRMRRSGFSWWGWGALCGGWPVFLLAGIEKFIEETEPLEPARWKRGP